MTRSGPALIVLPDRSYTTERAEFDGRAVSFAGRLRLGTNADAHREPKALTIPIGRCVRVEWLDDGGVTP
jgi:hypothetical protein